MKEDTLKINLGNIVPISTVDWYERTACTIFFNECPFRCPCCQNHKLLAGKHFVDIEEIEKGILDAKRFISVVVISGGEPTMQPDGLIHLAKFIKRQGLLVGIQTNGYYPNVLKELVDKKLVDKIFLDIKTDPRNREKYGKTIGMTKDINGTCDRIIQSLHIPGASVEVRTTIFRSLNDSMKIAEYLVETGYNYMYIIQQGNPYDTLDINMKKEYPFSRDEMISIAKSLPYKGVKIRTRENGEEYIR